MFDFNYKGIIFELETEVDSDGHSLIVMNVYHQGENLSEVLTDDIFIDIEEKLNHEIQMGNERAKWERSCRY